MNDLQTFNFSMIREGERITLSFQLPKDCTHQQITRKYKCFLEAMTFILDDEDLGLDANDF